MSMCACGSKRIIHIGGKVSDMFNASYNGNEYHGYVPSVLQVGSGSYISFNLCTDCGRIPNFEPVSSGEILEAFTGE